MKASYLKAGCVLLSVTLVLGLFAGGCKKATPPPEEPTAPVTPPTPPPEQAAIEKEFLSAPDVVTCELEKTTISELDLPKNKWPSFVRRMENANRTDVRQGQLTLANGGVFSYYEFAWPAAERLTDEAWRELLNSGQAPPRPEWTSSFIVE